MLTLVEFQVKKGFILGKFTNVQKVGFIPGIIFIIQYDGVILELVMNERSFWIKLSYNLFLKFALGRIKYLFTKTVQKQYKTHDISVVLFLPLIKSMRELMQSSLSNKPEVVWQCREEEVLENSWTDISEPLCIQMKNLFHFINEQWMG